MSMKALQEGGSFLGRALSAFSAFEVDFKLI